MNKAFITFISNNDYAKYVFVLIDSFNKTNSKYQLYCMVTQKVSKNIIDIIESMNCKTIKVDTEDLKVLEKLQLGNMCHKYFNALSKLKIFTLVQFEKCVYLDADMWIHNNIDYLLDLPCWSAVEGRWQQLNPTRYNDGCSLFNSGMFVFSPNIDFYETILNDIKTDKLNHTISWHDQAILAYYNQDWLDRKELHIDGKYNVLVREDYFSENNIKELKDLYDKSISHYINKHITVITDSIVSSAYKKYFDYINMLQSKFNLHDSINYTYATTDERDLFYLDLFK